MPISRRNLLRGIAAAGTAIAAGARAVAALAPNRLKLPFSGGPGSTAVLLNRNENAHGPSEKVQAAIRQAAGRSSSYPRGEYHAWRRMLAELHKVNPAQIVLAARSSDTLRMAVTDYL